VSVVWARRKQEPAPKKGLGAFLDESSEIEGQYSSSGTVVLDARVRGELTSKGTLIIGEHGVAEARVLGVNIVVRGTVNGSIVASERVELKAGARVNGDIEAPVIAMEAGAHIDGRCRTTEKPVETSLPVVIPLKA
jgi:cytoskeletal protein CcmA (bactofilin family)